MAVSKKGRRKITVCEKEYIWYIEMDSDSPYHILNIISDDKQLILSCPLNTKTPYIISKGKIFQTTKTNGNWNRYLLPFCIPESITPAFVARVISWATEDNKAQTVEWDGNDIPV